ncbi:MAG: hypothetical protein M3066_10065, partial [Actinomycetota bacterium]|nr:hypothetical protein [Actinomycetota bacterium]
MTTPPDDEALSAFADGEAPEWAAHVTACPSCRAAVEALRAVQAAVAAPIAPPDPGERDRAIAAAVAAGARRREPVEGTAARGHRPARWLVPASIAAVLL